MRIRRLLPAVLLGGFLNPAFAVDTTTVLSTQSNPGEPFNYSVGGDDYEFGSGADLLLDGATLASGLSVNVYQEFAVRVQTVDNPLVSGERSKFFAQLDNPGNTLVYLPSYPGVAGQFSYESILSGLHLNRGILDVFKNSGDGTQFAGNIERVDYVREEGLVVPTTPALLEEGGHLLIEKQANNGAQFAAILSLDINGNPLSYGPLVSVSNADMAEALPQQDYGFLVEGSVLTPPAQSFSGQLPENIDTSLEGPGGALVTWGSDLGLTPGQIYYGISLFPDDVSDANDLVGLSDFPLDTTDDEGLRAGGADIYAASGAVVASAAASAELDALNAPDADADGLTDDEEAALGTDPLSADSDNDGLLDFDELGGDALRDPGETDPMDADSDDDGINDGDEVNGTGPLAGFASTDPLDADSDADLIADGVEVGVGTPGVAGGMSAGSMLPYAGSDAFIGDADPLSQTDPNNPDTDSDGISDGAEDANQDGATLNTVGDSNSAGSGETDPNNPDTDGDGLRDGDELNAQGPLSSIGSTDPLDTDTDDGGALDGAEVLVDGTVPLVGNAADDVLAVDTDNDGLSDDLESALGTDPDNPDTDGDGLSDADEAGVDGVVGSGETNPLDADTDDDGLADGREVLGPDGRLGGSDATDPLNADSDSDGLNDGTEAGVTAPVAGGTSTPNGVAFSGTDTGSPAYVPDADPSTTTDPILVDSDADGINDGAEDLNADGATSNTIGGTGTAGSGETDPNNPDTDGDGLNDGDEIGGLGPLATFGATDPLDTDSDDGGIQDGEEALADGSNPVAGNGADDSGVDSDADGISDGSEASLGTDPNDPDSDNDGLSDGFEIGFDGQQDSGDTFPLDADSDDDGLSDGAEVLGVDGLVNSGDDSDPLNADTDNDGLSDGLELGVDSPIAAGNSDLAGIPFTATDPASPNFTADQDPASTTNPLLADTDGDGLIDGAEDANGDGATVNVVGGTGTDGNGETDPNNADTDGDGLSDGEEVLATGPLSGIGATDPLDSDTDDGSVNDGEEVLENSTDPTVGNGGDDVMLPPPPPDNDADGIPDAVEGSDDTDGDGLINSEDQDSDNDGASDAEEAGDNPAIPVDTDGDGIADFLDGDSDNDGFSDALENEDGGDFDNDGIADRLQPASEGELITSVDGGGGSTGMFGLLAMLGLLVTRGTRQVVPVLVLGVATLAATQAGAATDCGTEYDRYAFRDCWYAGIGYGGSHLDPERESNGWSTDDSESDGWEIQAGWHFKPRWFAEFKYAEIGEAGLGNAVPAIDAAYPDAAISYKVPSLMAGYLLRQPEHSFNAYLKAGASAIFNRAEDDADTVNFREVTTVQLALGLGVQYRQQHSPWFFRLNFDSYDTDAWYASLSINRYFGGEAPQKPGLIPPPERGVVPPDPRPAPMPVPAAAPAPLPSGPLPVFQCADFAGVVAGVQFASASDELSAQAREILRPLADSLAAKEEARVEIRAHTDAQGSTFSNDWLSERRANAVRRYFLDRGVRAVQLRAVGLGESQPVADNASAAGRAQNRRVELILANPEICR